MQNVMFSEAVALFLRHCCFGRSFSNLTLLAYQSDLRIAERFLGSSREIDTVRCDTLHAYINHLRKTLSLSDRSIVRRISTLRSLFSWAKRSGHLSADPFVDLDIVIRYPKGIPRVVTRANVKRLRRAILLNKIDDFNECALKIAIHFLLDTGIRIGELVSIRLSDLCMTEQRLIVRGKGNKERIIYLLDKELHKALSVYLKQRMLLGASSNKLFVKANSVLTSEKIRNYLYKVVAQLNITQKITPHMLRHTCATHWLESGLDIRYVQRLLGHQNITMTEMYTQVSDHGLRTALGRMYDRIAAEVN